MHCIILCSIKVACLTALYISNINRYFKVQLPTGSVRVERSPPEREVVSSSHSRVIPKTLKNGNRFTQLSAKLKSDIDKPERWLSSGRVWCERLPCPNGELNAHRTSYAGELDKKS